MSSVARLFGAVLLCALFAAPAHAQEYQARFENQCCYLTLESGETAAQFFEFTNTGTAFWSNVDVFLGTRLDYNRASPFAHPSWLSNFRAARVAPQAVGPQQRGRFEFVIQAPVVGSPTSYREHFQAVREQIAWIPGSEVFLDYTVLPSLAPSVGFTSVPPAVNRGATLDVAVEATDNRAVQRVEFSIGLTFDYALRPVQVETRFPGGEGEDAWFSWISKAKINYRTTKDGKKSMRSITVELCDWLYRAILHDDMMLTYNQRYFELAPLQPSIADEGVRVERPFKGWIQAEQLRAGVVVGGAVVIGLRVGDALKSAAGV